MGSSLKELQNEDALYAEGVADDMVADVPGYTPPVLPHPSENADHNECILSPKHQKEFD